MPTSSPVDFRVVRLTPPRLGVIGHHGRGDHVGRAGLHSDLQLTVFDIEAARAEFVGTASTSASPSTTWVGSSTTPGSRDGRPARIRNVPTMVPSPRSVT